MRIDGEPASDATFLEVLDRALLQRARAIISERLAATRAREEVLTRTRERLHADARELLAAGGAFGPDLLRLKEQPAAELFAASLEDAGIEGGRAAKPSQLIPFRGRLR